MSWFSSPLISTSLRRLSSLSGSSGSENGSSDDSIEDCASKDNVSPSEDDVTLIPKLDGDDAQRRKQRQANGDSARMGVRGWTYDSMDKLTPAPNGDEAEAPLWAEEALPLLDLDAPPPPAIELEPAPVLGPMDDVGVEDDDLPPTRDTSTDYPYIGPYSSPDPSVYGSSSVPMSPALYPGVPENLHPNTLDIQQQHPASPTVSSQLLAPSAPITLVEKKLEMQADYPEGNLDVDS
ncbi:hypothetical protein B0H14DRAFT_2592905 [Mycena olivaceomarginata]|nr:hypothetical protein B0H14DRAFT_2592905 [Mycena olivaceomarginata]